MRWAKQEDSQNGEEESKGSEHQKEQIRQAMKVLEALEVPRQEFGHLNRDGSVQIDPKQIEQLRRNLGKAAGRNVRFVALNAPFKRRSPTASA